MLNSLCCPEFSFNMGDSTPHAYVAYQDGGKETAPLTFIKHFPKSWRDKGEKAWDHNYLYKVFWSPHDDDTPTEMLKKVAEIPVFEAGEAMEKAGYYRAAVVAVKDTLQELNDFIETKRPSVGLSRFKYTSFDESSNKQTKSRSSSSSKASNSKSSSDSRPHRPLKNKKPGSKIVPKKAGIDLKAQTRNTNKLSHDLAARYPHLLSEKQEECADDTGTDLAGDIISSGLDLEAGADVGNDDQPDGAETDVHPSLLVECQLNDADKNDESDQKLREVQQESDGGLQFKLRKRPPANRTPKRNALLSSSSSEESSGPDSKRKKLDVDFTPRKYKQAKDDLEIEKNTTKRLASLNLRLQEKNFDLEQRIAVLEEEKKKLQKQLDDSKKVTRKHPGGGTDSSTSSSGQQNKLSNGNGVIIKPKPLHQSIKAEPTSPKHASGGGSSSQVKSEPALPKPPSEGKPQVKIEPAKEEASLPKESAKKGGSKSDSIMGDLFFTDIESKGTDSADLREADIKIKVEVNEEHCVENMEGCDSGQLSGDRPLDVDGIKTETDNSSESSELKSDDGKGPLQLCEGVLIQPKHRALIWGIPAGQKKDLTFIKDLAMVAFGPEELARCSIKGTAKGRRSGDAEQQEKKDPLDSTILNAVLEKFLERVSKEEDIDIKQVETHPRCESVRFNGAIRDLQKRARILGFGLGQQPDSADEFFIKNKKK